MMIFKANEVEANIFGTLEFKIFNANDLNDMTQIDVGGSLQNARRETIDAELRDDGSYYFVYLNTSDQLKCFTIDKNKRIVSELIYITFKVHKFKKYKNYIVAALSDVNGSYYVNLLNLNLQSIHNLKIADIDKQNNYECQLLAANDSRIYYFYNKTDLFSFDQQLNFITTLQFRSDKTGLFYLPTDRTQVECKDNKYYWLNPTHFQIEEQKSGALIKSVEIMSDKFIFDSKGRIIILNKTNNNINVYSGEGEFLNETKIENMQPDLLLFFFKFQ